MKQIAKVGEPPCPTAIPMYYRWVNTQKRRYYNLYVDYDLLGDLILLTTWGSLDTQLMKHLTISDHLPLFVSTKYRVFGTMNLYIHGHLLYSNDLADYIQLHAKDHDIVGGDFNISITLNEVLDVLRTVNGAASLTPITNSYVDKKSMTLDGSYLSTETFESEFLFEDYLTRENL